METTPLLNLDLRAPLVYSKCDEAALNTPSGLAENEEVLLCFELNPAQSQSIEPDPQLLIGQRIFTGQKTEGQDSVNGETVTLPAGKYLFSQIRSVPLIAAPEQLSIFNTEKWLNLAIEQQKDALWERWKPANLLFVRFLFEDGGFVTQIIRPCE